MESLEGVPVHMEEEEEIELFDLRRKPDKQIIGENHQPYFIIELKNQNASGKGRMKQLD